MADLPSSNNNNNTSSASSASSYARRASNIRGGAPAPLITDPGMLRRAAAAGGAATAAAAAAAAARGNSGQFGHSGAYAAAPRAPPPPPSRLADRYARKSAVKHMNTLVNVVQHLRPDIERAWLVALKRMGYPQIGGAPEGSRSSSNNNHYNRSGRPGTPATDSGLSGAGPFLLATVVDEAQAEHVLDNFRHHDAHVLAEGFFHFMEHDHHKGRLKDAIREVVETRVILQGFQKHSVLSAIMLFPTVVLSVCRDLSPDNQITLVEAPRVAVDCFHELVAKLAEKQLMNVDADSALSEIMPSSLLSSFLGGSQVVTQKKSGRLGPGLSNSGADASKGTGTSTSPTNTGGNTTTSTGGTVAAAAAAAAVGPEEVEQMLLLWCEKRMAPVESDTILRSATVGQHRSQTANSSVGSGGTAGSYSSFSLASSSIGSASSVGQQQQQQQQQQQANHGPAHAPSSFLVPRNLYPFIGATVNDRYIINEYMANGSFAHVWKALDTRTDRQVVVKIFRGIHDIQFDANQVDVAEEGHTELRNNRQLMALADVLPKELTQGMVSVVDVTMENAPAPLVRKDLLSGRVHYFCSEYCEERDLAFLRQEKPDFDEATAKYIFRQVMRTVKCLHDRKWYHQDIKLENIFVARDNEKFLFKIGDFGRLSTRHSEAAHEKGTLKCHGSLAANYFAPEVKRSRKEYYDGGPADVWAAGIVLLHMLLDAPALLRALEWFKPQFLRFLSPFKADEQAILRKRMAMNNYANTNTVGDADTSDVGGSQSRRGSRQKSGQHGVVGSSTLAGHGVKPIHFMDGSLELCSWLDNSLFHGASSAAELHKTRHDTVEDVWFRGNPVPMRILRCGAVEKEGFRAKGWYVIKENLFAEAERFVRRNTVPRHDVQRVAVTPKGIARSAGTQPREATGTASSALGTVSAEQARTTLLRRTVRWLQWKPVLDELQVRLRELDQLARARGDNVQSSDRAPLSSGTNMHPARSGQLVRTLLFRLADPVYIKRVVDSERPSIRGPRRVGKRKALRSPQDMVELIRALRLKDPSAVLKRFKLHAQDRPYVGIRLNGARGLDNKEAGKRGFISILQYAQDRHLESRETLAKWHLHIKDVQKVDVTGLCALLEIPSPMALKAQSKQKPPPESGGVGSDVHCNNPDLPYATSSDPSQPLKRKAMVLPLYTQLNCVVWEKSMKDDLRVNMPHLGAIQGSRVDPSPFNVLPRLTDVQKDMVRTFIQWGWRLQGLFDGLRRHWEGAHRFLAQPWPFAFPFLQCLDRMLERIVLENGGVPPDNFQAYSRFEDELLKDFKAGVIALTEHSESESESDECDAEHDAGRDAPVVEEGLDTVSSQKTAGNVPSASLAKNAESANPVTDQKATAAAGAAEELRAGYWTAPPLEDRHGSEVFRAERDFVKFPFDDMGAWVHFRENLKKRLQDRSNEGMEILASFPPELEDLLGHIFEHDPSLRYTALQVLHSDWMLPPRNVVDAEAEERRVILGLQQRVSQNKEMARRSGRGEKQHKTDVEIRFPVAPGEEGADQLHRMLSLVADAMDADLKALPDPSEMDNSDRPGNGLHRGRHGPGAADLKRGGIDRQKGSIASRGQNGIAGRGRGHHHHPSHRRHNHGAGTPDSDYYDDFYDGDTTATTTPDTLSSRSPGVPFVPQRHRSAEGHLRRQSLRNSRHQRDTSAGSQRSRSESSEGLVRQGTKTLRRSQSACTPGSAAKLGAISRPLALPPNLAPNRSQLQGANQSLHDSSQLSETAMKKDGRPRPHRRRKRKHRIAGSESSDSTSGSVSASSGQASSASVSASSGPDDDQAPKMARLAARGEDGAEVRTGHRIYPAAAAESGAQDSSSDDFLERELATANATNLPRGGILFIAPNVGGAPPRDGAGHATAGDEVEDEDGDSNDLLAEELSAVANAQKFSGGLREGVLQIPAEATGAESDSSSDGSFMAQELAAANRQGNSSGPASLLLPSRSKSVLPPADLTSDEDHDDDGDESVGSFFEDTAVSSGTNSNLGLLSGGVLQIQPKTASVNKAANGLDDALLQDELAEPTTNMFAGGVLHIAPKRSEDLISDSDSDGLLADEGSPRGSATRGMLPGGVLNIPARIAPPITAVPHDEGAKRRSESDSDDLLEAELKDAMSGVSAGHLRGGVLRIPIPEGSGGGRARHGIGKDEGLESDDSLLDDDSPHGASGGTFLAGGVLCIPAHKPQASGGSSHGNYRESSEEDEEDDLLAASPAPAPGKSFVFSVAPQPVQKQSLQQRPQPLDFAASLDRGHALRRDHEHDDDEDCASRRREEGEQQLTEPDGPRMRWFDVAEVVVGGGKKLPFVGTLCVDLDARVLHAFWSSGFDSSKWIRLKALLQEAFFEQHVARFKKAAVEVMDNIRMLALSGSGPHQQNHGIIHTMAALCHFFVLADFLLKHDFYLESQSLPVDATCSGDANGTNSDNQKDSCGSKHPIRDELERVLRLFGDASQHGRSLFFLSDRERADLVSLFMEPRGIPASDLHLVIVKRIKGLEQSLLSGAFAPAVHTHPDAAAPGGDTDRPQSTVKAQAPGTNAAHQQTAAYGARQSPRGVQDGELSNATTIQRSHTLGSETHSLGRSATTASTPASVNSGEWFSWEERGLRILYHLYCVLDITTRRDDVPGKKSVAELLRARSHNAELLHRQEVSLARQRLGKLGKQGRLFSQTVNAVTALPRLRRSEQEQQNQHQPQQWSARASWNRVRNLLPRLTVQSAGGGLYVTEHNKKEQLSRHEAHLRNILVQRGVSMGLYEYTAAAGDLEALCCDVGHSAGDGSPGWVVHAGHFSQILFESMRPSPHRRHLTAIHGALLSLCKHMAAPIRTLAGQPDTLFAEPIPEPSGGVSGSDDFGFEIMEYLNNDHVAREKWKEFALEGHLACFRPDVGPAPLDRPAEEVVRMRLMDLRDKKPSNWKDVRDRLCLVFFETTRFRNHLIDISSGSPPASTPRSTGSSAASMSIPPAMSASRTLSTSSLEAYRPQLVPSEEELIKEHSAALRAYEALVGHHAAVMDSVGETPFPGSPAMAVRPSAHVDGVSPSPASTCVSVSPFRASPRERAIEEAGQNAILEFSEICDMHIKRRFLTTASSIIKRLIAVQSTAHRAYGCHCLNRGLALPLDILEDALPDVESSKPRPVKSNSATTSSCGVACVCPWHLVDVVALLIIHCRLHNKSQHTSALKGRLREARARHAVAGSALTVVSGKVSATSNGNNGNPAQASLELLETLDAAAKQHARNEGALKNLVADFHLLTKDLVKMEESTHAYLQRLTPLLKEIEQARARQRQRELDDQPIASSSVPSPSTSSGTPTMPGSGESPGAAATAAAERQRAREVAELWSAGDHIRTNKRRELAKLAGMVGKIFVALGRPEAAIEKFKLALCHIAPLPDDLSDLPLQPGLSLRVSGYHSNLGKCYLMLRRWRRARCHLGQALTIKMKVLDKRHASIGATSYLLACVYIGEARAAAEAEIEASTSQPMKGGRGSMRGLRPGHARTSDGAEAPRGRIVKSFSLPIQPSRTSSQASCASLGMTTASSSLSEAADLFQSAAPSSVGVSRSATADSLGSAEGGVASAESVAMGDAEGGPGLGFLGRPRPDPEFVTGDSVTTTSASGRAAKSTRCLHDALALLLQALMLQLHQDGGRQHGSGATAPEKPNEGHHSGLGAHAHEEEPANREKAETSGDATSGEFTHPAGGVKARRDSWTGDGDSPGKKLKSMKGFHQSTLNTYCKIGEVYLLRMAAARERRRSERESRRRLRGVLRGNTPRATVSVGDGGAQLKNGACGEAGASGLARSPEGIERESFERARRAFRYAHDIWSAIRPGDAGPGIEAMFDSVEHGFDAGSPERVAALDILSPGGGQAGQSLGKKVTFDDDVRELE